MKERIIKKLSKRIIEILPGDYQDAWVCCDRGWCIGGELDYWGEGTDDYTVLEDFKWNASYEWSGIFGFYPAWHQLAGYPIHDHKRKTGQRLIEVARLLAKRA